MRSTHDPLVIRPGRPADADAIARMAEKLSRSQREPEHRLTPETVLADGFGPDAAFGSVVAEVEGQAVGYATFVEAYETSAAARGFYLCDLYVEEPYRRRGVGRALIGAVAAEARTRRRVYVWWASKPWNDSAHCFYRALGATHEPVVAHALFGDAFERLAGEGDGSR